MGGYFKTNAVIIICLTAFLRRSVLGKSLCDSVLSTSGPPLPDLPKFYSTNIRVNDEINGYSAEITRIVDTTTKMESTEYWSSLTHVKYISINKEDAFLELKYENNGAVCDKSYLSTANRRVIYKNAKAQILHLIEIVESKVLTQADEFKSSDDASIVDGISGRKWVFCNNVDELHAELKVTVFFSISQWRPPYPGTKQTEREIAQIEIVGQGANGEEIVTILNYYNYRPFQPTEEDFQLPELVHCRDYRTDKGEPALPIYFSYQSENSKYGTSSEDGPVISHRTVYYDSKTGLGRVTFEKQDDKTTISPTEYSIIYDFNLGVQYSTDSRTGRCSIDVYNNTFDAISTVQTSTNSILDSKKFFLMYDGHISYNGKYEVRGIPTDLYSGFVIKDKESFVCFWYFSTDRAKIIEGQEVEKKVLVKMVILPVSGAGEVIQGHRTDLNFYNFKQSEPHISNFDISPCFNDSMSRSFVITFPGETNVFVRESKSAVERVIHQKIQETAGVSRQRVIIDQMHLRKTYLFVQFTILDLPQIQGVNAPPDESNLNTAVTKVQEAVSNGVLMISFTTSKNVIIVLEPEPDGLKEFQGERDLLRGDITYNEGSVVGLAIAMTILGFLLGAVMVNLIISKKYGVSLFQKTGFVGSGAKPFENPLNESSM